jgi:hypothetical protein
VWPAVLHGSPSPLGPHAASGCAQCSCTNAAVACTMPGMADWSYHPCYIVVGASLRFRTLLACLECTGYDSKTTIHVSVAQCLFYELPWTRCKVQICGSAVKKINTTQPVSPTGASVKEEVEWGGRGQATPSHSCPYHIERPVVPFWCGRTRDLQRQVSPPRLASVVCLRLFCIYISYAAIKLRAYAFV